MAERGASGSALNPEPYGEISATRKLVLETMNYKSP